MLIYVTQSLQPVDSANNLVYRKEPSGMQPSTDDADFIALCNQTFDGDLESMHAFRAYLNAANPRKLEGILLQVLHSPGLLPGSYIMVLSLLAHYSDEQSAEAIRLALSHPDAGIRGSAPSRPAAATSDHAVAGAVGKDARQQ